MKYSPMEFCKLWMKTAQGLFCISSWWRHESTSCITNIYNTRLLLLDFLLEWAKIYVYCNRLFNICCGFSGSICKFAYFLQIYKLSRIWLKFIWKSISEKPLDPIKKKLRWNDSGMIFFENCLWQPCLSSNLAAVTKHRYFLKIMIMW